MNGNQEDVIGKVEKETTKKYSKRVSYLEKQAPDVYRAILDIPIVNGTYEALFKHGHPIWGSDGVDLTNKVLIGCLQLELEALADRFDNIEEKYYLVKENKTKWKFVAMEQDKIIFISGVNEIVKIPGFIFAIIRGHSSFDGDIEFTNGYCVYKNGVESLARIPMSLLVKISTNQIDLEGVIE